MIDRLGPRTLLKTLKKTSSITPLPRTFNSFSDNKCATPAGSFFLGSLPTATCNLAVSYFGSCLASGSYGYNTSCGTSDIFTYSSSLYGTTKRWVLRGNPSERVCVGKNHLILNKSLPTQSYHFWTLCWQQLQHIDVWCFRDPRCVCRIQRIYHHSILYHQLLFIKQYYCRNNVLRSYLLQGLQYSLQHDFWCHFWTMW